MVSVQSLKFITSTLFSIGFTSTYIPFHNLFSAVGTLSVGNRGTGSLKRDETLVKTFFAIHLVGQRPPSR